MKDLTEILLESHIDTTYHLTTLERMELIAKDWKLKASNLEEGINKGQTSGKYDYSVSLTRTRRLGEGYSKHFIKNQVPYIFVITFDNRALSSKYKIKPFDYTYNAGKEYNEEAFDEEYGYQPGDTGRTLYARGSKEKKAKAWDEWAETEERLYCDKEYIDIKKYIKSVSIVATGQPLKDLEGLMKGEVNDKTRKQLEDIFNGDSPLNSIMNIVENCRKNHIKLMSFDSVEGFNKNKFKNIITFSNNLYDNVMRAAKELYNKGDINDTLFNGVSNWLVHKLDL